MAASVFSSLEDGARGLLLSTCAVLDKSQVQYVIAGGWVPVLRDGPAGLVHPGTRDVDVLLDDSEEALQRSAQALLDDGFVLSAKHEFQLLRSAVVGKRRFIFNVDLMHPHRATKSPELFADVLDLGVTDAYDPTGKRWLKSMVFKSAEVVFTEKLWSAMRVAGVGIDGQELDVEIPLLSPEAFLLSKCESVAQVKRTRDAFDIYYMLHAPDGTQTMKRLWDLRDRFPEVREQVEKLLVWLRATSPNGVSNSIIFDRNVSRHARNLVVDASESVIRLLSNRDALE